jgi:diacylglycerol kinase family enzyme
MSRWALIYNPTAGRVRPGLVERIRHTLENQGIQVELLPTAAPGHASLLASRASGVERIAVLGGDGTFNEAANGLPADGPPLVFLPGGTANVMAHELGISRHPVRAALAQAAAAPVAVYPGLVKQRRFLLMAGFGFDGDAVFRVRPELKHFLGKGAYVWAGLGALLGHKPAMTLHTPDRHTQRVHWALGARAGHYGGAFIVHPHAGLTAPTLGLLGVSARCLLPFLVGNLGLRLPLRGTGIRLSQGASMRVQAETTIHVQIDGDYFTSGTDFQVHTSRQPIRLCIPGETRHASQAITP